MFEKYSEFRSQNQCIKFLLKGMIHLLLGDRKQEKLQLEAEIKEYNLGKILTKLREIYEEEQNEESLLSLLESIKIPRKF
jgi:hypothetical protein